MERITGTETVALNVPSDYATVADAVDAALEYVPNGQFEVVVNIESGHEWQEMVLLKRVDASHVRITSEDATVQVSGDWAETSLLNAQRGTNAPVWDVFVSLDGTSLGYHITRGSTGVVRGGAGVTNADEGLSVGRGAVVYCEDNAEFSSCNRGVSATQNAIVTVRSAALTDNTDYGIRAGGGSTVNAKGSDCSNCGEAVHATKGSYIQFNDGIADNATGQRAILASGGSHIEAGYVSALDSAGDGIHLGGRSTVTAYGATVTGATGYGASVNGGVLHAPTADFSGGGDGGARLENFGMANLSDADCSSGTPTDISVIDGCIVNLVNTTTTNGTPDVGDTSFDSFNSVSATGIAFA